MREIVDKHFPDNWILPIYQGHFVDLTEYWMHFKSAKKALDLNITPDNVKNIAIKHHKMIPSVNNRLKSYNIEGQLLEEFCLDKIKDLSTCLRDANVTIRWIMLHRHARDKRYKEIVEKGYKKEELVTLILALSKFEH